MKMALAFHRLGYDHARLPGKHHYFPELREHPRRTRDLLAQRRFMHRLHGTPSNANPWPDYDAGDYRYLEQVAAPPPRGMHTHPQGPGRSRGKVVISPTGYENLCYLMVDEEDLVDRLFEEVGSRLVRYYDEVASFDRVGACLSNDDWGFNTQTLLSPAQMERWLIPWHRKIAAAIHRHGKPALIHSCGNVYPVFDWITESYEGKHSYRRSILPVEEAYRRYHNRDRRSSEAIRRELSLMESEQGDFTNRSRAMLELSAERGFFRTRYRNSVPDYMPREKYFGECSRPRGTCAGITVVTR